MQQPSKSTTQAHLTKMAKKIGSFSLIERLRLVLEDNGNEKTTQVTLTSSLVQGPCYCSNGLGSCSLVWGIGWGLHTSSLSVEMSV